MSLINIRVSKDIHDRFKSIATRDNITMSELIRKHIREDLDHGTDLKAQAMIREIIRELRSPFLFIKSERGLKFARGERARREQLARKLEKSFKIKEGSS